MNILLIHAQPETTSLTHHLVNIAQELLTAQGHTVIQSDLYAMGWKAVFDGEDFPDRINTERLSFIEESKHAFTHGQQTADVEQEQRKVLAADAVIFLFPLWWFSMPAIMKGWIERVWAYGLAYGYKDKGNAHRYGEGAFTGKRALLAVSVGGPERDYSHRALMARWSNYSFPSRTEPFFTREWRYYPRLLFTVAGGSALTPYLRRKPTGAAGWQGCLTTFRFPSARKMREITLIVMCCPITLPRDRKGLQYILPILNNVLKLT